MIVDNDLLQKAAKSAESSFKAVYPRPHDLTPEHLAYYAIFSRVLDGAQLHMFVELSYGYGNILDANNQGTTLYGVTVAYPNGMASITKNCAFHTRAAAQNYIETLGEVAVEV